MISPSYNLTAFLAGIAEREYHDILTVTEQELRAAEAAAASDHGVDAGRRDGRSAYVIALKQFLFFMRYGTKPAGMTAAEFARFRPVCERLVAKHQFKPTVLARFEAD